jgi:hypothetical protein
MEAFGNQLLASPALAYDQYRTIERRSAACTLHGIQKCR